MRSTLWKYHGKSFRNNNFLMVQKERGVTETENGRTEAIKLGGLLPASDNSKGGRKTKTKIKQKTTQLSASVSGPLGKISDQHKPMLSSVSKSVENKSSNIKEAKNIIHWKIRSHLNFPTCNFLKGMFLGLEMILVGEQGQDIGSWLNIDDDGIQDDDFMGLEIPMVDLSNLNIMI